MEILVALLLGVLTASGVYLVLRPRTFSAVLGLTLLSHAVNLFLFSMGRLHSYTPAVIGTAEQHADPLPQALVLTAIVISFAMTAFVVALALRSALELRNDHVDGVDKEEDPI